MAIPSAETTVPRTRWLPDGVIAGFVATGASTVALIVAYLAAVGFGTQGADIFRLWLAQLTNNNVVSLGQGSPAIALALHVVFGLIWAVVYARFVEFRLSGAGWWRGMLFSLAPWVLSWLVFLPVVGAGVAGISLGAGPLPVIGNLVLHLVYGAVLGQLYDASADQPAVAADLTYAEPLEAEAIVHSEALGAAGIVAGVVVGALVGVGLAVAIPPGSGEAPTNWSIALAVGGLLAGGAVGGVVGSFAGLPTEPHGAEPEELELGPDPLERTALPFVLVPAIILVIAAIIVSIGSSLLTAAATGNRFLPVLVALAGTLIVGGVALFLARGQEPPSNRETVSHSGH